jgi:hypothetical protein
MQRRGANVPVQEPDCADSHRSCDILSYLSKSLKTLLAADRCLEFAGHGRAL